MGLLHQIGEYYTGGLLPPGNGKRSSTTDSSAPTSSDNTEDDTVDEYGPYGTQTLRRVRRATRRIGDKGNGR
jgi:hypothetical protein